MIRNKLHIKTALLVQAICLVFLSLGIAPQALAAAKGSCLIVAIQGSTLKTPQAIACATIFPSGSDAGGAKIDKNKCYAVTEHNASYNISKAISCSDKRFGKSDCPAGYRGTPPKCTVVQNGSCPSGETGTYPNCSIPQDGNCTGSSVSALQNCTLITKYLNPFINFLAALFGVAVVISISVGGIQYASSADDPQKVTAAKNRIRDSLIALLAFLFLYSLINFLIPGGLL